MERASRPGTAVAREARAAGAERIACRVVRASTVGRADPRRCAGAVRVARASVDAAGGGTLGCCVTLYVIRFTAFATAFMLSRDQARFFDCNKLPMLSTISGTVTLLIVYAFGEALYRVASSEQS